nr:hypothetical protein [Bradyrhizobium arachidis]
MTSESSSPVANADDRPRGRQFWQIVVSGPDDIRSRQRARHGGQAEARPDGARAHGRIRASQHDPVGNAAPVQRSDHPIVFGQRDDRDRCAGPRDEIPRLDPVRLELKFADNPVFELLPEALEQEQARDIDEALEEPASNLAGMFGEKEDAGEVLPAEFVEQPLCEQLADAEPPHGGSVRSSQPEYLVIGIDDAARLLERELAELGQSGPVRRSREELTTDETLQPFDLGADRGLAEIEPVCGLGHAARLGDCHDGSHDFHRNVLNLLSQHSGSFRRAVSRKLISPFKKALESGGRSTGALRPDARTRSR